MDGAVYTTFILVGHPDAVSAVEQKTIANAAYLQVQACGVGVVTRSGDTFELAPRGDLAVFDVGTDNVIDVWLGHDSEGRVVEVAFCGDEGRGALDSLP